MKNNRNSENVTDQNGKVVIITGANSGLGYENAKALAAKGAEIIMAVRDIEKGKNAVNEIYKTYNDANIQVMELDLSDLSSVTEFTENFKLKYNKINILINNAGVMIPPYSKTKDGFELQIGVNHLGHFALTSQLFDLIKTTDHSRIVNVSSIAHKQGVIDFNDINSEKKYKKMKAYGQSKLANLLFTYELNRRIKKADYSVLSVAAHPGWTHTNLSRHIGFKDFISPIFAQKQYMGALPALYAAVAADVKGGDYYGPGGWREIKGYPEKVESNELSHDLQTASELWDLSEEMIKMKFIV